MGITTGNPPPRLLDLTRLVSRAGRALTGVDRVEFAYLNRLLTEGPLWGLVRSSLGFILLDDKGCAALAGRIDDGDWLQSSHNRAAAERYLRGLCVGRCLKFGLSRMLRRHLPDGTIYVNTGHSNLSQRVLKAVQSVPRAKVAVFVHDTIPADLPEYQKPGTPEKFAQFLHRALADADVLICNSEQTKQDLERHAGRMLDNATVALLGVDRPNAGQPPEGTWTAPYFVTIGTIEPRKNHELLLDLWPDIPDAHLLICGNRGWNNDAVFARLDAGQDRVHELPNLPDEQLFGLLKGSAGLLFPSHAEGFGLPPAEAAALGVPVLCNDLGIYREFLGDIPVYVNVTDRYLWKTTIKAMADDHIAAGGARNGGSLDYEPPSWDAHFNTVLNVI